MVARSGDHPGVGASGDGVFTGSVVSSGQGTRRRAHHRRWSPMNEPVNAHGREIEPKVFDAEFVAEAPDGRARRIWWRLVLFVLRWLRDQTGAAWRSPIGRRVRAV